MPAPKTQSSAYQLKIALLGIEPPIWRRIQVPSTILLCCLHDAIQAVMGWTDNHLHHFEKDGKYWSVPEHYEYDDETDVVDETKVAVEKVLMTAGDSMLYVYDLGDNWRHEVVLEKILPSEVRTNRSALVVNGTAHRKMLEDRQGIRNFWRSSSCRGMKNLSIIGPGQGILFMQRSLTLRRSARF